MALLSRIESRQQVLCTTKLQVRWAEIAELISGRPAIQDRSRGSKIQPDYVDSSGNGEQRTDSALEYIDCRTLTEQVTGA